MGDVQFLPGYCLLLPDPVAPSLNDLDVEARATCLLDMARIGGRGAADNRDTSYELRNSGQLGT